MQGIRYDPGVPALTPGGEEELRRVEVEVLEYLLRLITASHNQQPRYMDTVALSVRPFAELAALARILIQLFDIDWAIGQQLDFTGQWIGLTRFIDIALDVWFSFDIEGLGWDQGKWQTPYELTTGALELGDNDYRKLLKAKIVANHWDGTIPGAEAVWNLLFEGEGYQAVIQDGWPHWDPNCRSSMNTIQALMGPMLDRVHWALFAGGYMGVKSAGVGQEYMIQFQGQYAGDPESCIDRPLFAFDTGPDPLTGEGAPYPEDPEHFPPTTCAGWDHAAWGVDAVLEPTFLAIIPEAPQDDQVWVRTPPFWTRALPLEGGHMEGPLKISENPTEESPDEETHDRTYWDDFDFDPGEA